MKLAAIVVFLLFCLGWSWPWLIFALLLWELGGDANVIKALWISTKISEHRDHD